jgi:hypothetical protein
MLKIKPVAGIPVILDHDKLQEQRDIVQSVPHCSENITF